MSSKKAEWSDYAYDNESISKRLGIDREEVKKLKGEAAKKSEGNFDPNKKVDIKKTERKARGETALDAKILNDNLGLDFGLDIDFDNPLNSKGELGIKIPGFGLSIDSEGGGEIDLLGTIRIETIRIKCYYVQRFYFANQFLYSDIQRVDSEECNKKEEPKPEPPNDDIEPPEPLEPWPPEPRDGSDKVVKYFLTFDYRSRIVESDGTNQTIQADHIRAEISSIDLLLETFSLKTTKKRTGRITETQNFPSQRFSEGYYKLAYMTTTQDFLATYEFTVFGLVVALFVVGTEKTVLNYIAAREYENYTKAEINGTSYNYLGYSKYYISDRRYAGFQSESNNVNLPSGYPENTYSLGILHSRTKKNQIIDVSNYVEQPILLPPLNPLIKGNENMEDCCRIMRKLAKYQGLGEKIDKIKIKDFEVKEKGGEDENFPMEVPKRWFDRKAKPDEKTEILNMRHLLLANLTMLDRFEELFNPAGKDSAFPLKKPEEGLWKWLPGDGGDYRIPDPNFDPKKSKDDGKIGSTNLKIETYLDLFRYFLESQIRLEMLFPIAQIRDSKISKRLIYPKATGEIQINDLIQFQELFLLYINKTLGDPAGPVIIKDADPIQEGAQPVTIENFDISEMLRKLIRFSVDINSDVDLANNFGKRTLYQLLSAMQVLVKNHELTEAIFEDLGMTEEQAIAKVKLYADPYAGGWKAGEGFDPNRIKVENTESNIEANLEAFLQETEVDVKVSRRAPTETTDLRDLLAQIGRYAAETAAQGKIPNTPEAIQAAIDKARFELQTDSAIRRVDVRQASAAGRVRTKRNNKKKR